MYPPQAEQFTSVPFTGLAGIPKLYWLWAASAWQMKHPVVEASEGSTGVETEYESMKSVVTRTPDFEFAPDERLEPRGTP